MTPRLVFVLGAGYTGLRVARQARAAGAQVVCAVRSPERADSLRAEGFEVWQGPALDVDRIAARLGPDTQVVIAFPPDGETDARLAPTLTAAGSVRYVSTTGVYGPEAKVLDPSTPVSATPSKSHARVLEAEAGYRAVGATILRAPGIYGPDRGLHVRVVQGKHTLAGDGDNVLSRIHVEDLAALLLARPEVRSTTYVVGDGGTDTQREVVAWICAEYGVPFPPSVPVESVHASLRVSRRIDPSKALHDLGVTLKWPSFREGMARSATRIASAQRL